jgi:hypothetical protein
VEDQRDHDSGDEDEDDFRGRALPGAAQLPRRAYPDNLIHCNRLDRGGHVAAWEQPQLFSEEMRAGFQSLRTAIRGR